MQTCEHVYLLVLLHPHVGKEPATLIKVKPPSRKATKGSWIHNILAGLGFGVSLGWIEVAVGFIKHRAKGKGLKSWAYFCGTVGKNMQRLNHNYFGHKLHIINLRIVCFYGVVRSNSWFCWLPKFKAISWLNSFSPRTLLALSPNKIDA